MFDLVLSNGNLITMNQNNDILCKKDIFIKDGKILAIRETINKKNINHGAKLLNFSQIHFFNSVSSESSSEILKPILLAIAKAI